MSKDYEDIILNKEKVFNPNLFTPSVLLLSDTVMVLMAFFVKKLSLNSLKWVVDLNS
jgi:hypothetical protein